MSRDNASGRYKNPDDQPTYRMSRLRGALQYGQRLPLAQRLADPVATLGRLPSRVRITSAWILLLVTAEMGVIARYSDGYPRWALALAVLVRAPLNAAFAAVLLVLLGRLTHATARLFGGRGHSSTTTELVVLFAAGMAVPAGIARLLWNGNDQVVTVVELVLSVVGLLLGVRLVARLEALSTTRAAFAIVLPGLLVVTFFVLLTVIQSYLLPAGWRLG